MTTAAAAAYDAADARFAADLRAMTEAPMTVKEIHEHLCGCRTADCLIDTEASIAWAYGR